LSQKTSVIYEPRGKAREYAPLAVNLYTGCGHGCSYCYAPATLHTTKEKFSKPSARNNILEKIEKDANKLRSANETGPVLLCFTCDPYQPIDEEFRLSRQAIQILHSHSLNVKILTKGGKRAERDFDLLTDNDWFGVTLTNLDDRLSLEWEPGAALPGERVESLVQAHNKSIKTWVSLEPVLCPEAALEIIRRIHMFVDEFKIGVLNYHPHAQNIDWHKFAVDVTNVLTESGCKYYLKSDLKKYL
jgi:DNA repair photolyase